MCWVFFFEFMGRFSCLADHAFFLVSEMLGSFWKFAVWLYLFYRVSTTPSCFHFFFQFKKIEHKIRERPKALPHGHVRGDGRKGSATRGVRVCGSSTSVFCPCAKKKLKSCVRILNFFLHQGDKRYYEMQYRKEKSIVQSFFRCASKIPFSVSHSWHLLSSPPPPRGGGPPHPAAFSTSPPNPVANFFPQPRHREENGETSGGREICDFIGLVWAPECKKDGADFFWRRHTSHASSFSSCFTFSEIGGLVISFLGWGVCNPFPGPQDSLQLGG